jgi:putative transposase
MRELERWLTLQIVDIYHQRVHRSIVEPPIKAWEKTLTSGQVTMRYPVDAQKFYIDFLPGELRLIRRDGIQLFGAHYWDNILSPLRRPLDGSASDSLRSTGPFSCLYKATSNGPYLKVPYRDIGHPTITLNEHRSVVKQLKRAKQLASTKRRYSPLFWNNASWSNRPVRARGLQGAHGKRPGSYHQH